MYCPIKFNEKEFMMKLSKLFGALAIAGSVAGCANTNSPYTKNQGLVGVGLAGAVISRATGGSASDGAVIGGIVGYLTGNPCERVVRDNLNTYGRDIDQVNCSGVAARGYGL